MASIALAAAGSVAGKAAFGGIVGATLAGAIGSQVGSTIGGLVDGALFGGGNNRHREGARLEQLAVQTSTYGIHIPLVYGSARIAGNVIWSQPMKEIATTTTTTQGKGGGGGASSSTTEYSYFVTLAIAICEGPVDTIERVWADAKQLDLGLGTYRFYKGDETQLPDALIESIEGVGSTPAYRGLCYVVIEDFPLAAYGNRIPNFTFEVKKKVQWPDVDGESVENLVKEMVMIPGSGEFVYDTQVQQKREGELVNGSYVQAGEQTRINMHNPHNKANAVLALDQLEEACPNVEYVALVVNWFGTNDAIASCEILPGVEFTADQATTTPETWSVAGFSRDTAHPIVYVNNTPRYGGTPDDQSILRLCDELKARGYKILFLPLFLMDTDNKPWRGRLTGTTSEVANFFTKANGYNAYVLHYANLLKDKVDAFAIGSELRGLTEVHNGATTARQFPGVDALVSLAATVKGVVGAGVQVTYAADWSEYHHATDGWYHMDALWASPNIDVIGIDAYFPLTDAPQSQIGYDPLSIKAGWTSGEGYDWYYTDSTRTTKASLAVPYAWKNIEWFWKNNHVNPDGATTAWVPESKKIWFTEYGFPSVDAATNQPNVFYDPSSSESFFPYGSKGRVDFRAQRAGVAATLAQWKDSAMIEKTFLWTWDARPYPYWPDLLSVWADGGVWVTGHWVQGKFGLSALAAIVADLCYRAGLDLGFVDVSQLTDQVDGFVVARADTARGLIEQLMAAYFFDAAETDGRIKFVKRGQEISASVQAAHLVPQREEAYGEALEIIRLQELELPQRIEVNYLNRLSQYQTNTQASQRQVVETKDVERFNLPIVMSDQQAKSIADVALYQAWMSRTRYRFDVAMRYADLEPCDVVMVQDAKGVQHQMRITQMRLEAKGRVRLDAVAEDAASYDFYAPPAAVENRTQDTQPIAETQARFLDLPALPNDGAQDAWVRVAAAGLAANWPGAVMYRTDDGGASYGEWIRLTQPATMGTAATALPAGSRNRFDEVNTLEVVLLGNGTLASISEVAMLNGGNLLMVGEELIQFQHATLIGASKYRLSRLLRGRQGTEYAMAGHTAGESCVLLNAAVQKQAVSDGLFDLPRDYKALSIGQTLGSVSAQSFTYQARALKPYAPVHASATRDGSGNVTLQWVRRTRVGGHLRDGADVPLSETNERYEVVVRDGADAVRVIAASEPTASYSAAEQIADFGALPSTLSVEIYQLSERVGRGYPLIATV